jgi:hypothetical protein
LRRGAVFDVFGCFKRGVLGKCVAKRGQMTVKTW